MLRLTAQTAIKGNASFIPLAVLSLGQLISWGSLYYSITFLAEPIQREMRWSLGQIFGAFSSGLLLAAMATPLAGRFLHQHGGRFVISIGSLLAALALATVASSYDFLLFQAGWLLAGIAMSMTLYEAAFSTLQEIPAINFRRGVSVVTIVGGLASTIYWPLTYWLVNELGWRATLFMYAGIHLFICFPLHVLSLESKPTATEAEVIEISIPVATKRNVALLAIAFALASLVTAAISSHASVIMTNMQVPSWLAMTALALIGPMQVAGRIAELAVAHRASPVMTGIITLLVLAFSLLLLQLMCYYPWLAVGFALVYGVSNGVMTVVRGTVVAELFDKQNYALMLGMLSMPAMFARSLGAVLMAWTISVSNLNAAIWMLTLLTLLASIVYWYASKASLLPIRHR